MSKESEERLKKIDASIVRIKELGFALNAEHLSTVAKNTKLRDSLLLAISALEKIAAETIYTYDDGNEGPYVKLRAKTVAREALSSIAGVVG